MKQAALQDLRNFDAPQVWLLTSFPSIIIRKPSKHNNSKVFRAKTCRKALSTELMRKDEQKLQKIENIPAFAWAKSGDQRRTCEKMETNETGFVGNCWEAPSVHCQTTSLNLDLSPIREFQQCFIRSVQHRCHQSQGRAIFPASWQIEIRLRVFIIHRLDASACINKAIRSNWHFIITTPSPTTNNSSNTNIVIPTPTLCCLTRVEPTKHQEHLITSSCIGRVYHRCFGSKKHNEFRLKWKFCGFIFESCKTFAAKLRRHPKECDGASSCSLDAARRWPDEYLIFSQQPWPPPQSSRQALLGRKGWNHSNL